MRPYLVILLLLFVTWDASGGLITKRAQLSSKRDAVGGIQVADQFYFAGGLELNDYIPTNIVEIYNITSGEWEEPIYLEEPRGFISTAVIGQNIYFIGGFRFSNSCAMLYNSDLHQYEDIGCGPTVRQAIQISNHNSTVTVLGAFSADFYNITSAQWYYRPKLTTWMQSMSGGAVLVHENLVIGIGGVNATTFEQINDAWIYDTYTDELTVFSNATTADIMVSSSDFSVAHGRIVINVTNWYFVHEFGTTDWHEGFMPNISNVAILPDAIYLFNATGFTLYDWSSMESRFVVGSVVNVFVFENQLVMEQGNILLIYESQQLTTITLASSIRSAVRFGQAGDKYVFYTSSNQLRLYDSQTKSISDLSLVVVDVKWMIPFDDTTLVLFTASTATIYYLNNDTSIVQPTSMTYSGQLIGTDIVSVNDWKVWINLGETRALNLTFFAAKLIDNTAIFGQTGQNYFYMDVFNHVTREWQPRIPMDSNTSGLYSPVVVIDDLITVGKRRWTFRYNVTSGESSTTPFLARSWPVSRVVNTVPVVKHTGYLPGSSSSMIIYVNSTTETYSDDLQLGGIPVQFVTSNDNIIYMTVADGLYYSLHTYDIANDLLDTLILPQPQDSVSIAIFNDTLIALGSDGNVYGLLRSDKSTWYKVPLQNNFVRPIAAMMKDGTMMVAAGKHISINTYTDELLFINASAVIELGTKISISQPITHATPSTPDASPNQQSGLTQGELAAAIVVPVVVVIGGVIALIVLLIKRRRSNIKKGSSNTVGLEARYGAWFTPFNQITFGEQLGQGASGQVFKGTWKNTTVALKVSMTQANNSVIAELELMMQLRPHPNVVQLLGFSVHPETDSIILIIEFCEGGSLDAKLHNETTEMSFGDQVQWLVGVAKGLSHLHSNNIVHRDVAARNVLLDRNEPKLTDFGMSRLVDEQKQHGTTKSELGPIRWMSPESLRNREYSTKSDVWSFGILMYEVIARQEPHSEADPIEIGRLIRDSGLTPVIPSSCPSQLADVMKQCWQMSPQSRPTIEAIIPSLEAVRIS